jgi:hypothetical protein
MPAYAVAVEFLVRAEQFAEFAGPLNARQKLW